MDDPKAATFVTIRSKRFVEGALVFFEFVNELGGIIWAKDELQPIFDCFKE
jgi:hypothetical protein